MFRHH